MAAMHILILKNCYGITNLLLRKFTFTENQTFLQKFSTMKIWSCHAAVGPPGPSTANCVAIDGPPDQVWLPWMVHFAASGPPLASRLMVDKTVVGIY